MRKMQTFVQVSSRKTIHSHYAITVNPNCTEDQKATTILHEIGHILCGHLERGLMKNLWPGEPKDDDLLKPPYREEKLSSKQMEFEAECVCNFVCDALCIEYDNKAYLKEYMEYEKVPNINYEIVIKAADKVLSVAKNISALRDIPFNQTHSPSFYKEKDKIRAYPNSLSKDNCTRYLF